MDVRSASAVRALGLAHMIQGLGYKVVVMGKFHTETEADRDRIGALVDDVSCRNIERPVLRQASASYVTSAEALMQVVDEIGANRVRAVICYNYPARGALSMIREARLRGIAPILDCTEWYGWEGPKIWRNIWRLAGVEFRMRVLTRIAGNVVCASRWFQARVERQHTVLWPFVLDTTRPEWRRGPVPDPARPAHLVYSGSPGVGMHKDRLPVMIAALDRLAAEGLDFQVSIAGLTQEQYLDTIPDDAGRILNLSGKLKFLGRVPHTESLELLRDGDFSVFFREPNRVSNTGFATKYVEAATLGVPVISNPTSDIALYLDDGTNGIMAKSIAANHVEDALRRAVTQTPVERAAMVAACRAENPFDMRSWQGDASAFLKNLRGLR